MALTRLNNRSVSAVTSFVTPSNITSYSNIGPWQHIETRAYSTDTATPINFFVFNNNYVAYKVILPYWNCVTENAELYLRFTTGTSAITENYYYQSRTMMGGGDNSHNQVSYYPTNEGIMWDDFWSSENGGVHGEIIIYNASTPTLNNIDTNRGTYYRPYATYTLVGYDTVGGQGYARVDGAIRYNLENAATYYSGFQLYHSGYAAVKAKSHVMIYGLRKV